MARNWISCQGMYCRGVPPLMGMHALVSTRFDDMAPQRFEYLPKCSAPACSNIETKERPHSLRCDKCFYFHYCGATCQAYCDEFTNVHKRHCSSASPQNVEMTKGQMQAFLGLTEKASKQGERAECTRAAYQLKSATIVS